jgi:hypothetical protein
VKKYSWFGGTNPLILIFDIRWSRIKDFTPWEAQILDQSSGIYGICVWMEKGGCLDVS